MMRGSSLGNLPITLVQIGRVIESIGGGEFVSNLHGLINSFVPVDGAHLAKWVVDERTRKATAVLSLGTFGSEARSSNQGGGQLHIFGPEERDPLLGRIVDVDDPQLFHRHHRVHFGAPDRGQRREAVYQCALLSRRATQRFSVSLQRTSAQREFSLSELSALRRLADIILPLVERHGLSSQARGPQTSLQWPQMGHNGTPSMERRFEERLKNQSIVLSRREREVCIALLLGSTAPMVARELGISESTAATYMRRAAIKLNLNGRHGLLKWVIGFDAQQSASPTQSCHALSPGGCPATSLDRPAQNTIHNI